MKKLVIIGAGLTGLAAAAKVSEKFSTEVTEKNSFVGGISSTFKHKEYLLDYGPHKIYTQMPEVMQKIKEMLGKDLLTIKKESKIRLKGKYYNYPLQIKELLLGIGPITAIKCGMSYGLAIPRKMLGGKEKTYEDYVINRFGKATYELVFKPLAEKYWGNPKELSAELAKTRISMPGMMGMLKLMLTGKKPEKSVSADYFNYPKKGIIQLAEKLAEKTKENKGKITLNAEATKITIKNNKATTVKYRQNGKEKETKADYVISTAPIDKLPEMINAPAEIKEAAKKLKYKSLMLIYITAKKDRVFKENWIFFPEKQYSFSRLSEQKGFSSHMIPAGKTVLTAEMTYDKEITDKEAFETVIKDLEKAKLLKREEAEEYFIKRIKNVYPVYDLEYKKNLGIILQYLDKIKNLIVTGRYGLFNYNNMDHCMDMGNKAAEHILSGKPFEEWKKTREQFKEYRIVD